MVYIYVFNIREIYSPKYKEEVRLRGPKGEVCLRNEGNRCCTPVRFPPF